MGFSRITEKPIWRFNTCVSNPLFNSGKSLAPGRVAGGLTFYKRYPT